MSKTEVLKALQGFTLKELIEVIEVAFGRLRQLVAGSPQTNAFQAANDLDARHDTPRTPGQDSGKVFVETDFNEPLPDCILNSFLASQ